MAWSPVSLSLWFITNDSAIDLFRTFFVLLGFGESDFWASAHPWFAKDWLRLCLGLAGLIWFAFLSLNRRVAPMNGLLGLVVLLILLPVLFSDMIVTPWRESSLTAGFERSLDAFITGVCGMAVGIIIARLASPHLFGAYDQKLLARDQVTACVRHWIGTMALSGALLGWQAMTPVGVTVGLISVFVSSLTKLCRPTLAWNGWTVWVWLSVFIYINFFSLFYKLSTDFLTRSPVAGHLSAAIGVYVLAIFWKLLQPDSENSRRNPERQ